jgi:uncharacterized protein
VSASSIDRLPPLPAVVEGHVSHSRRGATRHAFRHGAYQWLVDLDALPRPAWWLRPFVSFRSEDHLGHPTRSIRANVEAFLRTHDVDLTGGRILMLANARVLGHVFDPLTVFWCFAADGRLACLVAEVHNTYGERYAYLLHPDGDGTAYADKQLYVSPFYDVSGQYRLRFTLTPTQVASSVVLTRDREVAFVATFRGVPRPASNRRVATLLLRRPLMPQQVSALIRVHGIWLWLRRLPVIPRPGARAQEGVRA